MTGNAASFTSAPARPSAALDRHGIVVAAAVFSLVALAGILARPLLPIDETRYVAVAWEMRRTGNWLVPHLNGELYTHKPPLLFWLINLVWLVTGPSEFAARLVGPAFGAAAIVGTGLLGRRLWPEAPAIGNRAALVLASFSVFTLYAGLTMFDAILTCAVLLGVIAVASEPGRPRVALFGVALGVGVLAKGPVILVHLAPVYLAAALLARMPVLPALCSFAAALGVGLGIVALWLVPAIVTGGPEYRDAVLWTQSAGRVANPFDHARPWWFFLVLLPLLLWPWAWTAALWRLAARHRLREDRSLALCLTWAVATLVLFSVIASKQLHYLLPALPAAALAIARVLGGAPVRAPAAALVPVLVGIGLLALGLGYAPDPEAARLAEPGWGVAVPGILLLGLAAAAFRLRGSAVAALGLGLVLCLDLVFPLAAPGRIYDAHPMAEAIMPHDDDGIGFIGEYAGQFTFAARLRNPLAVFEDVPAALAWLGQHPGGVLVARLEGDHPDEPSPDQIFYRDATYGLWRAP